MSPDPFARRRIDELETYLYREIPLSRAMGVVVEAVHPDRVILAAPIEPNLNHKHTAFGGSLSAVAILAGWTLIHCRLETTALDAELVIRSNRIDYRAPVHSRFVATARLSAESDWAAFERQIRRSRMARIETISTISADGDIRATLHAEFVALPR
jgi:thioesterase domain-containing protein